jgi:signal transduction histidine kinase
MTLPIYFEVAGLVAASVAWVFVALARHAIPAAARLVLFGLLAVLLIGHVVNILEWSGATWADTVGDQLSIVVPLLWGLFLLEIGRSYLTAQVDANTEQLRFFLEKVPVAVACLSADSCLQAYSLTWSRTLPASNFGTPLSQVLPVPLRGLERAIARSIEQGSEASSAEESSQDASGRTHYYRWAVRGLSHPDHQRPLVLVMLEETTSTIEAEANRALAAEELGRAQRLAHVGQLAAGAAHDFNNLLHVIHMAALELQQRPNSEQAAQELQSAIKTASSLTRSMLQFGKAGTVSRSPVDLRALVLELQGLLNHVLGRRHRVVVTSETAGPIILYGNESRLQQAVLNLITNARDAMPEGGDILVTLSVSDHEVELRVQDTGVGMSEEVRKRLFSPFFTTKDTGGTGLGLSVVRSAVEEHRGTISVDSELGVGTTFRVKLPLDE